MYGPRAAANNNKYGGNGGIGTNPNGEEIKFSIQREPIKRDHMITDHKENMSLMFYDFNNSTGIGGRNYDPYEDYSQQKAPFEQMSKTSNNFFQNKNGVQPNQSGRGDRLPTRDAKSRSEFRQATK
jgi:hypothetical protein